MLTRILPALLALSLAAPAAYAQTVVQHGQSLNGVLQALMGGGTSGGNGYMFQTDASGNLYIIAKTATRLFDAVTATNLAVGAADSSGVLDVEQYPYLKLLVKAVPRTGVNTTVRLGFQFRECMNNMVDSTSSFATYMYGTGPLPAKQDSIAFGVAAGQARLVEFAGNDTVRAGHLVTGAASTPWSGEYVVVVNGNRSAPGNGAAATVFSYPNALDLPLDAFFGRQVRYSKLQIRVRNLNANSPGVDVTVKVLGFTR